MFLFKNREPGGSQRSTSLPEGPVAVLKTIPHRLAESLTAEEKPERMLLELGLLVLLLHAWILTCLFKPEEAATSPRPLLMEVSLITATAPKPQAAPPPQATQPRPAPKKIKQKPPEAKKPPISRKPDAVPQPERKPSPAEAEAAPKTAPALKPAPAAATQNAAPKSEPFTEANYRANYEFNPKPNYPRIARSRGWQGKVLLRVQVSAAGTSEQVTVQKSSGHEILDESAIEAVKQWRFIPARRGNTPVASSVVVPILFSLQN